MAKSQTLLSEFGDHLAGVPDEDSNKGPWLLGYGSEWLIANLDRLYHSAGDDAGVEKWIREAYKTYVEPIDLPGVPNVVIEAAVDVAIVNALVAIVIGAHRAIHSVTPPPSL